MFNFLCSVMLTLIGFGADWTHPIKKTTLLFKQQFLHWESIELRFCVEVVYLTCTEAEKNEVTNDSKPTYMLP